VHRAVALADSPPERRSSTSVTLLPSYATTPAMTIASGNDAGVPDGLLASLEFVFGRLMGLVDALGCPDRLAGAADRRRPKPDRRRRDKDGNTQTPPSLPSLAAMATTFSQP
jgi:hypothetical protein